MALRLCCSSPPVLDSTLRKTQISLLSHPKGGLRLGRLQQNEIRRFRALCFNLPDEPILKEALKEPVAFMGGVFAGLLRLDLNEDPLKEWVSRIVEGSGMGEEENDANGFKPGEGEEAPEQIEI